MARYTVKASVTVDVEMSIEAVSADAAREMFDNQIVMTAGLIDMQESDYDVSEDSISGVADLTVEAEAA